MIKEVMIERGDILLTNNRQEKPNWITLREKFLQIKWTLEEVEKFHTKDFGRLQKEGNSFQYFAPLSAFFFKKKRADQENSRVFNKPNWFALLKFRLNEVENEHNF